MSEVIRVLSNIESGDPSGAAELLPLVYDELRKLAALHLASEKPGQTLDATALVHEAYLRLIGNEQEHGWNGRRHFYAAAAEAMRRILIENARRKNANKRGGRWSRVALDRADTVTDAHPDDVLALDEALEQLKERDPIAGQLVMLRYYAGLPIEQAAEAMGISPATAYRHWTFARAWIHGQLLADGEDKKI